MTRRVRRFSRTEPGFEAIFLRTAFHKQINSAMTDYIVTNITYRDREYTAAALIEDRPPDESRTKSAELVHRAQMYIKEHAAETIDFESLAQSLGLTYRSFRYLISKETSSSPLQYQLGVRLARAKNLLKSSDMPIAEIAETLGFNSTWYFSHFTSD